MTKLVVGFVELLSSQPNASLAVGSDWVNPLEDFPQPSFFLPYNLNLQLQLFQELNFLCWQAWLPATKIFSQESLVERFEQQFSSPFDSQLQHKTARHI